MLKLPPSAYNPLSAFGAAVALVCALVGFVLLTAGVLFEEQHNPYFGIFLYLVLPAVLVTGLLLIPIGMWRRRRRGPVEPGQAWPVLDLNRPGHRNALLVFVVGTVLFLTLSGVGSYEAYHYSESVEFCGTTCHQVMEPEYTTYQHSPHARVACASCHIGEGADWFVKSKLSGVYQIYAAAREIYPRPIETPIENLRPAQETCERCHWPQMAFGDQQRLFAHYKYDDESTPWTIEMLMKTGGGNPAHGPSSGIHWHVDPGVEVEYLARDHDRQDIPWVRVTDRHSGEVTVYVSETAPPTEEELAALEPRRMDCIDCHNRPSHIFRSPDEAIDSALLKGTIPADLPSIKRIGVEAMAGEYATLAEAREQIASEVAGYYRTEHPDLFDRRRKAVELAVDGVQTAYSRNVFPHMNAKWSVYPSNAGHFDSIGCMRCHAGDHVADDGRVVTHDCTACHTILSQGAGEDLQRASTQDGLEFVHPEDIAEMWREVGCWECHQGLQP